MLTLPTFQSQYLRTHRRLLLTQQIYLILHHSLLSDLTASTKYIDRRVFTNDETEYKKSSVLVLGLQSSPYLISQSNLTPFQTEFYPVNPDPRFHLILP